MRQVMAGLKDRRLQGFITEEIRERGARRGFQLQTVEGDRVVLARIGLPSAYRVGRYAVDVQALDGLADSVLALDPKTDIYLVDEIGKMECLSVRFVAAMERLLDSYKLLVATVAARGGGLIESVKRRPGVVLWSVTRDNRDGLVDQVLAWIRERESSLTR
jgi:nucleoside-triphosphatase